MGSVESTVYEGTLRACSVQVVFLLYSIQGEKKEKNGTRFFSSLRGLSARPDCVFESALRYGMELCCTLGSLGSVLSPP